MTLSVIYKISTESRLPLLRKSLLAVQNQPQETESVVVIPENRDFEVEAADAVHEIRTPSLTAARNAGAKVASGEYIAFMDDDAFPDLQWGQRILAGFEHADVVGGPLYPDSNVPSYLPNGWHWLVGCGPYYEREQIVPNTYGSNIAVTREAFEAVDGFDESIGMGSGGVSQGGETDLCRRIREAGYQGVWYDPLAIVHHNVGDRANIKNLHTRAFRQGISKATIGTGGRESRFLREEANAFPSRTVAEMLMTVSLIASVGAGYCWGKVR